MAALRPSVRRLLLVVPLVVAVGVVWVARTDDPLEPGALETSATLVALVEGPEALQPTPSLDAARADNLLPYEWPWFSDRVDTPPDAYVNGGELLAAIRRVPELAALPLLSAEQRSPGTGEEDARFRWAWIKFDDTEVISVATHVVSPGFATLANPGERLIDHAGGWAAISNEPGIIRVRYLRDDRVVDVGSQATPFNESQELSMDVDGLVAIAEQILTVYEG